MISQTIAHAPAPSRIAPRTRWTGFVEQLGAAAQVLASRRALLELEPRMLKDLGITHAEAVAEARRAPWDLTTRRSRR
jgi:uncharacterized protein YjiS (DUF1127 family)